MKRGELYRVFKGNPEDTNKSRVFVIVSRQILVDSRYSTVTCAPVFTSRDGLSTQVLLGPEEGLKHDCAVHCDELVSIQKARLKHFIGSLSGGKMEELNNALRIALDIEG